MRNQFLIIMITCLLIGSIFLNFHQTTLSESLPELGSSTFRPTVRGFSTAPEPGTTWTLDTEFEFNTGNSNGLVINPEGSMELEMRLKGLVDNFIDEGNISVADNVYVDSGNDTLNLIKSTQTFGKVNSDEAQKFIQTSDGGYAILGNSEYTGSDPDVWLLKLDNGANLQWSSTFGGSLYDMGFGFAQTSDNGFIITGYTVSYGTAGMPDLWLIKTDSSGNEQWNVTFDTGFVEVGFSTLQMIDGGYLVGGHIDYQELLDSDAWVIKTDGSGNMVWNATYGGNQFDHCEDLIVDIAGGFVFTGYTESYSADGFAQDAWLVKINGLGTELWNKSYGGALSPDLGNEVIQTSDGGFAIIGNTESYDAGMGDAWLIKTNNNGIESWNQTYGGTNQENGLGILQTKDNGYAIIGYTTTYSAGMNDLWLIKTDANGLEEWSKTYGASNEDTGQDLVKTPNGYGLVGDTMSFSAGLDDVWLLMVDENGNFTGGWMQSTNLLANDVAIEITEFEINTILSLDTFLKVRFSNDGTTWVNSAGEPDGWDILLNLDNFIDLTALNWSGSVFYYELNFTTESVNVPKVEYTYLKFTQYKSSGTYHSALLNTVKLPVWKMIEWTGDAPKSTALKFQIRTASTEPGLSGQDFLGPDGTNSTYYIISGTDLWEGHNGQVWLDFKIYMETTDLTITPTLYNVTLGFNTAPEISDEIIVSESFEFMTEFNFSIIYTDLDDDPPDYAKICIDDVNYSMNEGEFVDTNYTTGREYWYKTEFSSGNHTFRYFISDGELENQTNIRIIDLGTGPLARLEVKPKSVSMTTDEFQKFTAVGYDMDNNIIPVTPTWEVTGGGTIASNGTFTPTIPGIWTVFANASGITGNATAIVTLGELDNIDITPKSVSITTDEHVQFEVKGYDADGNELVIMPDWTVTGGGTIDTTGNFTATTPGTWTVFANVSGLSVDAEITVTLGSVHTIVVEPIYTEINESENAEFNATAYDADGNLLPDVTINWEVNGGAVINYAGKLTGKVAGNWTVYANSSGVSGTAKIWVKAKPSEKPDDQPDDQPEDQPEDDEEDDTMMFTGLVIIVIIIVVMLVLFVILLKRKSSQEVPAIEDQLSEQPLPEQVGVSIAQPVQGVQVPGEHQQPPLTYEEQQYRNMSEPLDQPVPQQLLPAPSPAQSPPVQPLQGVKPIEDESELEE